MNKKQILKKACGKGGPMDGIKNTAAGITGAIKNAGKVVGAGAKGAVDTFKSTMAADQKNLGFRDPGSYLNAGVRGLLGGVAGAAKEAKELGKSPAKLSVQKAVKKVIPFTPTPEAGPTTPRLRETLQKEAPETLKMPTRNQFSSTAAYKEAQRKFTKNKNWASDK
jgi:hypothetical protein